jgi:hypothetical protein
MVELLKRVVLAEAGIVTTAPEEVGNNRPEVRHIPPFEPHCAAVPAPGSDDRVQQMDVSSARHLDPNLMASQKPLAQLDW